MKQKIIEILGVCIEPELADLKADQIMALLNTNELLKALQAVFNLIDKGVLVRDISKDDDYSYFLKQGIEIHNVIVLMNEAIEKAVQ